MVNADGTRTLRFTDVTDASGIEALGYGMGVATGDFNNDGCVDLYLTNLGPNQMFRNNCDGTFSDVSNRSWRRAGAATNGDRILVGLGDLPDFDRDGWLDLFVGHYLDYRVEGQHALLQPVRASRLLFAERLPAPGEPPLSQQS